MKTEFETHIFIPNIGFDWRLNSSRLYFGGLIIFVLFLIIAQTIDLNQNIIQGISFLLFLIIIAGSKWGYNEKEKKFGKLEGQLLINDRSISINEIEYPWDQISNLSFNLLLILDDQLWSETYPIGRYYGGPAFSQGVDNYINFDFEGKAYNIYFQLKTFSNKVELSNILKRHFFMGHIELQRTYNGLHLEYEQIQELKKQKSNWDNEKSS